MTGEDGPGIGIMLRMALDMPEELGATAETSAVYREQILSGAASAPNLRDLPVQHDLDS